MQGYESFYFNGQVYSASTGWQTAAGAGNFPLNIVSLNLAVAILVISAVVSCKSVTSDETQIKTTTSDPTYATLPGQLKPRQAGGVPSAAKVTYATTTQAIPGGDPLVGAALGSIDVYDLAETVKPMYLIPANGGTRGLTVWHTLAAAGDWITSITWIEL